MLKKIFCPLGQEEYRRQKIEHHASADPNRGDINVGNFHHGLSLGIRIREESGPKTQP